MDPWGTPEVTIRLEEAKPLLKQIQGPEAKLTRYYWYGRSQLKRCFSRIFLVRGREISLKSEGEDRDDFLGIGTMLEIFQSSWKVPDMIEELNIIVIRGSDIERAVFFSIVAEIPSGPEEVCEGN